MMGPRLFWIEQPFDGRLAVTGRPVGGLELENEVASWRAAKLDVIVSMLEPEEADDLGLGYQAQFCRQQGIAPPVIPPNNYGKPNYSVANDYFARNGVELRYLGNGHGSLKDGAHKRLSARLRRASFLTSARCDHYHPGILQSKAYSNLQLQSGSVSITMQLMVAMIAFMRRFQVGLVASTRGAR